ncbi:MAG: aconitase family protein [Pirellulaceae bacterium]
MTSGERRLSGPVITPTSSATYDRSEIDRAADIAPQVTWGTNPGQVIGIDQVIPSPSDWSDETERKSVARALEYMGLEAGSSWSDGKINRAFIGSCTNARIEDLRAAAEVVRGHRVADGVHAMVVPGSGHEATSRGGGTGPRFLEAGFERARSRMQHVPRHESDKLGAGRTLASTSNRNFEGRQGKGGRTHLVSPAMAAAAAITGSFTDVRDWKYQS